MKKIIREIWGLLDQEHKRTSMILVVMMLVGTLLEAVGISVILPVIGVLSQPNWSETYPKLYSFLTTYGLIEQHEVLLAVLSALLALFFTKNIYLALLAYVQAKFAFSVRERVSLRLLRTYMYLPYPFHLENNSALLLRNITSEAGALATGILLPVLVIATELMVVVALVTILIWFTSWSVMLAVMLLGIGGVGFFKLVRLRLDSWGELRQFHDGMSIKHIQQALGGVKNAKVQGCEETFLERFAVHNTKSSEYYRYNMVVQQFPRLWFEVLAVLSMVCVIIILINQQWKWTEILPVVGLFAAAAFRLAPSANRILISLQTFRYYRPVLDVVLEELKRVGDEKSSDLKRRNLQAIKSISLNRVSFSYPGRKQRALNNINLKIIGGLTVGIIGDSGSGKSTLVDAILGLLKATKGQISYNGRNIEENIHAWQQHIGYVPQSVYLLDDTLLANIAFGIRDDDIDEEAVRRAAHAAQLNDFIESLEDGLNTKVGERGERISGGQRQRIGIARALYHDPPILVLDEATSALDTKTEKGVMQAVYTLQGNKTILIVAHRLSTVKRCDMIIRLQDGCVAETGSFNEVVGQLSGVIGQ